MSYTKEELLAIRQDLHQIAEIGLQEFETNKYLLGKIAEIVGDADNLEMRQWQTGIIVKINGSNSKKIIGWRTDIDALPLTEETGLPFASVNEGVMHACGHDLHMTIALGLLKKAMENPSENDRLFFFQPAEENFSGAKLMVDEGCFDGWYPDEFYAAHVKPELPTGVIATNNHTLFAGACEVKVTFTGKSGHAAFPHEANDMVVAASAFVMQAQTLVSRNINPQEQVVVTFGSMNAGMAGNIIADEAVLLGTIRTYNNEMTEFTQKRIRQIAEGVALSFNCEVLVELNQAGYVPVVNDKELADTFLDFMQKRTDCREIAPLSTAEDFGYLLNQTKGVMFWLGVDAEYPLHHQKFSPDAEAIFPAVEHVSAWLDSRAKVLSRV